jgi:hypothetical protein
VKLNRNVHVVLAAYFILLAASSSGLNRYAIVAALALFVVVALRFVWGILREARGWSDLGDAYVRYVLGEARPENRRTPSARRLGSR